MLTFNQLLAAGALDPSEVRLLRHRDPDGQKHARVFHAAMCGDESFREYQELQGTESVISAVRATRYLAAFVVEPESKATVFAGVWRVTGDRIPPHADPFGSELGLGVVAFTTERVTAFDEYRGRVVIEWGSGTRAWVQLAHKQDKRILEVRRIYQAPTFPGFAVFRHSLGDIEGIPVAWADVLRNARGVYLLVHRERGDQYVGGTYGADGFLGRWLTYLDGHGGNVAMKELGSPADAYDVAILETVGTGDNDTVVAARESAWKVKLGTRVRGLNRN